MQVAWQHNDENISCDYGLYIGTTYDSTYDDTISLKHDLQQSNMSHE